ncbi:prepilin-type N-terminal cleavage/methylation domain-containing protein [Clostridium grantii]|uniref:N-terminal methylation site-containing protein n=1 Tax=Clostridium grantii DSM 8605 TaxID=1121316 RepID=A0A1M5RIQ0_9CLOT|nr:prepilin-type N-terminal cleavage/methylation domain-containing protein [Clostridium grantii]SHH25949.1 N-terminal methylation site-containing protein [Clostridium grantii DSM 8605]
MAHTEVNFYKKRKKGFTLIELIIVIAILGILSAIAIPKFNDYKDSASIATLNANEGTFIKQIALLEAEGKTVSYGTTNKQNDLRDFLKNEISGIIVNSVSNKSDIFSTSNNTTFEGAAIVTSSNSTKTMEYVKIKKDYYPLNSSNSTARLKSLNGTIMVVVCSDGYLLYGIYDDEVHNFQEYHF